MTWSVSTRCFRDPARVSRRRRTWLEQEPGAFAAVVGLVDALRRGLERWLLVAGVSTLLALVAMAALALMRPAYAPSYVLRVVETDHDPGVMPRPKRQLAAYVREAVFTSAALLPSIQRHRLYPRLASLNPPAALESFREDIDVEVYENYFVKARTVRDAPRSARVSVSYRSTSMSSRKDSSAAGGFNDARREDIDVEVYENYFVEARTVRDAPRSARVSVSYRSTDPDQALAVTQDLGRLIAAREQDLRRSQAAAAVANARDIVERRSRALSRLRSEIIDKQMEVDGTGPVDAMREVELVSLFGALGLAERELQQSEKRLSQLQLGALLEKSGNGLRFEVADEGDIPLSARLGPRQVGEAGAAAFVVLFPFVAIMAGAPKGKGGGR